MTSSAPSDRAHDFDEPARRSGDVLHRAPEAAAAEAARPAWAGTLPLTDRIAAASAAAQAEQAARGTPAPQPARTAPPESIGRLAIRRSATVGAVDDPLERQADAVADSVVRRQPIPPTGASAPSPVPAATPTPVTPAPVTTIARSPSGGSAAAVGAAGGPVSAEVERELDATRGSGAALAPEVRADFERALGTDLSDVRVHTDPAADRLADQLAAVAFTRGSDVYFRSGRYQPASGEGRRLLAHELAHVRQNGARSPAAAEKPAGVVRRKPGGGGGGTGSQPVLELPYLDLPQYKIDKLPNDEFIPIKPGCETRSRPPSRAPGARRRGRSSRQW